MSLNTSSPATPCRPEQCMRRGSGNSGQMGNSCYTLSHEFPTEGERGVWVCVEQPGKGPAKELTKMIAGETKRQQIWKKRGGGNPSII